jgi:hypothetical protein
VDESGSSPSFLPTGRVEKLGWWWHSPTRWVLRWPTWSCVRVGRKRELRRRCTQSKRRQGGAQGSAHCGVGCDGGGGRSSDDRAAPRGSLLHRWGEGGEWRKPASKKNVVVRQRRKGGSAMALPVEERSVTGRRGLLGQRRRHGFGQWRRRCWAAFKRERAAPWWPSGRGTAQGGRWRQCSDERARRKERS